MFFSVSTIVLSQENYFKTHRTGRYYYYKDNKDIIVIRTKFRQYEIDNKKHTKLVYKVKWIDDRNFQLIFIKGNVEKLGCLKRGFTIDVKIIEATKNSYKWGSNNNECGGKFNGEFFKIN